MLSDSVFHCRTRQRTLISDTVLIWQKKNLQSYTLKKYVLNKFCPCGVFLGYIPHQCSVHQYGAIAVPLIRKNSVANVIKCRQNTCRGVSSPAVMASTVLRETKAQTRHGGSSRVWRYRSTIFTIVYSADLSQTAGTALHHTANSLPVMKRGRGLAKVLRHTRERRGSHSPVVISRH